jgi:hypothetical protein
MTEEQWLSDDGWQPLRAAETSASVRKLRLITAAIVRRLQSFPEYQDAKPCDDLYETLADGPGRCREAQDSLQRRPGDWRLTHALLPDDTVGLAKELRRLVAFAPACLHQHAIGLLHDVISNPFRSMTLDRRCLTPPVAALAEAGYEHRELPSGHLELARLAVLSDALEEAGCTDAELLAHLRSPGPHVRGCWALDLILGKS